MSNEGQTSTVTAVRVGALAGLVVCLSSIVPIWVAGADWRDGDRVWLLAAVVLPNLWVAVSTGTGSFWFGAPISSTVRGIVLGLFGWLGMIVGFAVLVLLVSVVANPGGLLSWPPTMWQWLIFWACVGVPGGAYLGVAVAKRAFEETREEAASLADAEESLVGYDWGKVSRRCGFAGLLFALLAVMTTPRPPLNNMIDGRVLLLMGSATLLSTAAVVIALWTRSRPGWICGLLAFVVMAARMDLVLRVRSSADSSMSG